MYAYLIVRVAYRYELHVLVGLLNLSNIALLREWNIKKKIRMYIDGFLIAPEHEDTFQCIELYKLIVFWSYTVYECRM